MKKIAKQLTDLVGNTPLMELSNYNKSKGLKKRWSRAGRCFSKAGISESGRFRKGPYRTGND